MPFETSVTVFDEWLPLDVLISGWVFGHENHQTLGELSQNDASMIIKEILKDKTLRRLDRIPKMQNAAVFLHRYNSV